MTAPKGSLSITPRAGDVRPTGRGSRFGLRFYEGQALQGTEVHLDPSFGLIELIPGDSSVPAPPSTSGAETQEPPGSLLSMTDHVCQVPHDTSQVVTVDVRKKAGIDGRVGGVLKSATRRLRKALNGPVPIQDKQWNMRRFIALGSASKFRAGGEWG